MSKKLITAFNLLLWRLGWNSAGGGGKGVASSGDSTAATLRQAAARVTAALPASCTGLPSPNWDTELETFSQLWPALRAPGGASGSAEKPRQWTDRELTFRHQHEKGTNFTCFLPKRSPSAGASPPEPLHRGLPAVVCLVDGCTRAWEHTQVRAQGHTRASRAEF